LWSRAAHVLLDRGHSVRISYREPWRGAPAPLKKLHRQGARIRWHGRSILGRSARRSLARFGLNTNPHIGWLDRTRPDLVVITIGIHTDDCTMAEACRRRGIPYVVILQAAGDAHWMHDGNLDDFRGMYLGARACFFVSRENLDVVETNLAARVPHTAIVANPFNVSWQAAPVWPDASDGLRMACVGRLHMESKGQDLVVEVMRRDKWRSRPLHVAFWGSDHGDGRRLRDLIRMHGLGNRLSIGGYSNDIEQLWSRHHALLLPSRYEGSALALLEAMICGRTAIATTVGRAGEFIADDQTGFLARAATADMLDEAMERAWHHRGEWRAIGAHAGQRIRSIYSSSPEADFASLLEQVASGSEIQWQRDGHQATVGEAA
jgi:glycosyltransferase involved in cell wall biosynthesis